MYKPSSIIYTDLTFTLAVMFAINSSLMVIDFSVRGNLSNCVVLYKDLTPVSDKKYKSSPIDCIESLETQPIPLITSSKTISAIISGLL